MHKILLVDDMKNFLDLEQSFLKRADCRVFTANTGLEAIKVANMENPDLIILDIEMPEMNGIEACRILKHDGRLKRIPVVMLTSLAKEDEARRAGADHFLKKPIDEDTFIAEIKRFLPIVEREEIRVDAGFPLDVHYDQHIFEARASDLSKTGIFVATDRIAPLGARLTLSMNLPAEAGGKWIQTDALVVRTVAKDDIKGMGCRFVELSSGAQIYVNEYIEKHR